MNRETHSSRLNAAADHLVEAAQQLRRFSTLGFGLLGDPAATEIEKLATALRERSLTTVEHTGLEK